MNFLFPTLSKNENKNEIIDNLFIGNKEASQYEANNFALIVNCSKDIPFSPNSKQVLRIAIDDHPGEVNNLLNYMINTNILEQIHTHRKRKQPVLVHCFAGMQRSCAVVACYLMKYYNVTPLLAINFIKQKRSVAFFGGVNFMKTLEMYHGYLHK